MAISTSTPANAELTDLVEDALNRLHIPPSLLGYSYLTYCIGQVVQDPLQVKGLTRRPLSARFLELKKRLAFLPYPLL